MPPEFNISWPDQYDHHGRLFRVNEPSGAGGGNVSTTHSYDAGSRLVNVRTTATVSGASITQDRWFSYDGRGFLTSENHPEKGQDLIGNGLIDYADHDARGHAGRIVDGPNDLAFTYDAAERLTFVGETGGRPLKQYVYDVATGWGNGKLASAARYNYPVLGTTTHTAKITESYTYWGIDGRASQRDTALTFNGSPGESFTQTFGWNVLGDESTLGYPKCTHAGCGAPAQRDVTYGYTNDRLTSVASAGVTYGTFNYHVNQMINQVAHANGITDTHAADPFARLRPASITSAAGGVTRWTTGGYVYDGTGNVTRMGTSWYTYDKVNRLTAATVFTGTTGGGTQKQQTYTFDPFGNLTAMGGTSGRSVPVDPETNRLSAGAHDTAGNLTSWNGNLYQYDAFSQMWRMKSGNEEWLYVYTADDERVWSFKVGANFSRWTLRDLSGQVLREYNNNQGTWSVAEDYFYRNGLLLASETPSGRRHFHLDHLGTPRLITNATGSQLAYHVYYPFGEEAAAFNQDAERMKFTGHERDLASLAGAGDDLDYMHARHFGTVTARFTSFDPIGGNPRIPQSWNRYAYVLGNPLKYIDPTGMMEVDACFGESCVGSITVSGAPWTSFAEFLWAVGNFGAGFVDASASNFAFGRGRHTFSDPSFQAGQATGDFVSIFVGLWEVANGIGGFTTGTLFDLTPGGSLVGVPVQLASLGVIVHGATNATLGYVHLMGASKRGGSSDFRGTDALRRHNKIVRDVATKLKLTRDQQQRLHREVSKQDLTYNEILQIAQDMFGK